MNYTNLVYMSSSSSVHPNTVVADDNDILAAASFKYTEAYRSLQDKETQMKYYKKMNSAPEVQTLVEMDSKPFGSVSEKMLCEIFGFGPRTSSQNDGTRLGKKIEIKAARYWAGMDDCRWQHLEPDHDYEFALLALLDFHGWKLWCISKSLLMGELREKKIVTFQGKQGWWTRKSDILPYLTPIHSVSQLDAFITTSGAVATADDGHGHGHGHGHGSACC